MSYLSDFEHTKLDAHVFPDCVVQKHYISSAVNGQRRVPVTKIWKVKKLLGKGTFGEVRLEACSSENNTNEERAVKRIWTTGKEFKSSHERELKALLEFSKPKYKESAVFVEFFGWFEDLECVYLTMEYLPLGDLEDNVLAAGGSIKETEVRDIAVQVLEGLRIMHLENFAHRDLKTKNVLVCQGPPNWWVKLADFGLSKRQTDETGFRTQIGTVAYMAPEILNYIPEVDPETSEYTNAVDMWALGCIVYRLLCGAVPFPPGPSLVKFCLDKSKFPLKVEELTGLAQTFVNGLIVPYPSQRLTAQQALEHPWTRPGLETSKFESQSILSSGYATGTHPAFRSHELATPTPVVDSGAVPKTYHPPTVEEEEGETESDTGEPESTMRPLPTKPKSSETNQDKPSNWTKPSRRSDGTPRDSYANIAESPIPPPAAPKKPYLQTYASQPSMPPSRKKPDRPEPPGQDSYIIEPLSPLPRTQTFTGDQVQPLTRAPTFQAKDHAASRLKRTYMSPKSDSDSDTTVYTSHRAHKPSRPDVSSPIKIQPTFGQQAIPSRLEEQTPTEPLESTKFWLEDGAETFKPYAFTPQPPRREPELTRYTIVHGTAVPRLSIKEEFAAAEHGTLKGHSDPVNAVAFSPDGKLVASASHSGMEASLNPTTGVILDTPTIPLTQENLEKHTQTRHGRKIGGPYQCPPAPRACAGSPPRQLSMSPVSSQSASSKRTKDRPRFYANEWGYIDTQPARRSVYVEAADEDIVRPSGRRGKTRPVYVEDADEDTDRPSGRRGKPRPVYVEDADEDVVRSSGRRDKQRPAYVEDADEDIVRPSGKRGKPKPAYVEDADEDVVRPSGRRWPYLEDADEDVVRPSGRRDKPRPTYI